MVKLTDHLTSISPGLQSGPSPGRRLMALAMCLMVSISAILPAAALADEADSEGEGVAAPVEAPAPDFDPGGEETVLEEAPASEGGAEESEPVEVEAELDTEAPTPSEVTSAATEEAVEEVAPPPVAVPGMEAPAGAEYVPQQEVVAEPVENQPLQAPRQTQTERHTASSQVAATEAPAGEAGGSQSIPAEPSEEAPNPASAPSGDSDLSLAGKRFYVVQPGDCLTYIAEALLPAGATEMEIEDDVDRLWRLNEDRIGTGDRNLIYVGTVLRLR